MKKSVSFLLTLILAFSLCACAAAPAGEDAQVANPLTEFESLDALNEATGSRLAAWTGDDVKDEVYLSVNCGDYVISEYRFTVGGVRYSLRSAPVTEDISGRYVDGSVAFPGEPKDGIEYADGGEGVKLARWFNVDGQYVFSAEPGGDDFAAMTEQVFALHLPANIRAFDYDALLGDYQDSVSQRATMSVTAGAVENEVNILVSWASSAEETTEYEMSARLFEDGLLRYDCCAVSTHITDENGTDTGSTDDVCYSGYFTVEDGKLLWTGAHEEQLTACVFEKIPG